MTRAEREGGKRLCDAATPGPWTLEIEEYEQNSGQICISGINRLMHDTEWADPEDWERDLANSHFIAHARTAYPAALKEIDRLEAENAALREALTTVLPFARHTDEAFTPAWERFNEALKRAHALLEGRDAE